MKGIPPIKAVMTPFPYWVDSADSLERASTVMQQHGIHHLPVMELGALVGVLAARDLRRAMELVGSGASGAPTAGAVCERHAYTVELTEPLDRVLAQMASRGLESALVVKDGKLAGIFTTTDACRSFERLLRQLFPHGDGDEAA